MKLLQITSIFNTKHELVPVRNDLRTKITSNFDAPYIPGGHDVSMNDQKSPMVISLIFPPEIDGHEKRAELNFLSFDA